MNLRPLIPLGWGLAGALALVLALVWMQRRGWIDSSPQRTRRGTGHALLGLQQFIEPSVEHIFQAENGEQREGHEGDTLEDEREAILADLALSLGRDPVDRGEVQRHLASVQRLGLDWREAYEQAVRAELTSRPFRAPSIPPIFRVAPPQ